MSNLLYTLTIILLLALTYLLYDPIPITYGCPCFPERTWVEGDRRACKCVGEPGLVWVPATW